jgi:hypothetical protein
MPPPCRGPVRLALFCAALGRGAHGNFVAMPYTPLVLPHAPEPLRRFVEDTIDKYLRELHCLYAIAVPAQAGPRQLQISIATMLLAVISGTAATLTTIDLEPGAAFVEALKRHYPWDEDPPAGGTPGNAAHILYNVFRNPIVHTGFALKGGRTVKTGRRAYSLDAAALEREVERIETSPGRPFSKASIVIRDDAMVLWVDCLCWGVRQMIERALNDPAQCERVWERISSGKALMLKRR